MRSPSISLCMIVKNEARQLAQMLQSVQHAVDEIIVIDTGSTDKTVAIAKQFGATVVFEAWENDFAKARNAGLQHASGQWILFMDADEMLDQEDIQKLRTCADDEKYEGFFLQVHNYVHREGPSATVNPIVRMFKNCPQYRFEGAIHEQIAATIMRHRGDARFGMSDVKIHHYGYIEEIMVEKDKRQRNMTLLQAELRRDRKNPFYIYNIAVEYLRMGNVQKAYESFHEARLLLSPETSYTHLVLKCEARCLGMLGKTLQATQLCQDGISWYNDYTDLYHYQSSFFSSLGLFERAKMAAAQALRIGSPPSHYHTESGIGTYLTWYDLGTLYEATHDYAMAVNCYIKSVQLRNEFNEPLYRIFRILHCTGEEAKIETLLAEKFVIRSPKAHLKVISILFDTSCYTAIDTIVSRLPLDETESPVIAKIHALHQLSQCLNQINNSDMSRSNVTHLLERNMGTEEARQSFRIRTSYADNDLTEALQQIQAFHKSVSTDGPSAEENAAAIHTFVHCMSCLADHHLSLVPKQNASQILQDLRIQLSENHQH